MRQLRRAGFEITMILDLIHVIESLWAAAWDVCPEGAVAAEKWVRKKLAKRESIDKAAAYLLAYKSMLRYDEHLPAGLPIATGVIEGACRHLVKDRMDITGDMDAYWQLHKRQEFWRNHASRYADAEGTWLWQEAA